MKIIHSIQNSDVLNATSLSMAFSRNRINKRISLLDMNFFVADKLKTEENNIYRIKGSITLDSEEKILISKAIIYFPESHYSLERIVEAQEYELDFIHQTKTERDYFNIVVFDKDDLVISSSTYVFDENRVIEHPIQKKDMSDLKVQNKLTELQDSIVLETEIESCQENSVMHVWQNVGQHYKFEKLEKNNSNTFISSLSKKDMCSGIWMVIVVDKFGKLVTQFIVKI